MAIHDQTDWREVDDSFALDVTLVESVFRRLDKREYNQCPGLKSSKNQEITRFDEKKFAKADVLLALETTDSYLAKRPLLRVLHTRFASVSIGATLQDFVRFRLRDRTVSLRDVKRELETIYADAKRAKQGEDKHKSFVNHARIASPWCVHNPKWLHSSPARQLYHVHALPQAKVRQQVQSDWVASQARAVVNAAIGLVLNKVVAMRLAQISTDKIQTVRCQPVDALNARPSRRQAKPSRERDSKLQALRLELFAPTAKFAMNASKVKDQDSVVQIMMQLATVEAQGDCRRAHLLLDHDIVQSELRCAAEQAQRLGMKELPWAAVKLWRDLYRTSTLQAIEMARCGK